MAAPLATIEKDPDAKLTYTVAWTAWLATDTISSVDWTVPAGLTNEGTSSTSTTASITLSGGTVGNTYDVKCKITCASALVDKRTLRFIVVDR